MARRRQAGDVDDILDADRHAVQRPARAPRCDLGLGGLGDIHRGVTIEPDEHIQSRIEAVDTVEQRTR